MRSPYSTFTDSLYGLKLRSIFRPSLNVVLYLTGGAEAGIKILLVQANKKSRCPTSRGQIVDRCFSMEAGHVGESYLRIG